MQKIQDDLTDKPLSKQQKWQIRKKRQGKCVKCGKKLATTVFCQYHREQNNKRKNENSK